MASKWKQIPIIECIELIGGGTPKTSVAEYWDGDIPWLSVKDFNNDYRHVYATEKHITEAGLNNSSTKLLQKDDIIISARGTVGEMAMIPFPMAFNQSCYGIRAKDGVNSTFLYYLLKSSISKLKLMTHGSVFDTITRDTFATLIVGIPDEKTQDAIAATLATIDDKIELNQKINDNLLAQMQLLYQNLLDSCVCSPIRLEEVSQKIAMGPFGSNIKVSTFVPEGVPIISGNHLRSVFLEEPSYNYITEEHAQKLKNSMVYPRDIVFTHAGNIGQVAMIPQGSDYPYYMISQRQFYMRCDETKVIPELVLFFFHSREGKGKLLANANSTGVPSIAQPSTHLKNIEMSMPNKADQDEWYKTIKPMVDMYVALCQENKRLISLRDSLLPHLMSGELDVSAIQL